MIDKFRFKALYKIDAKMYDVEAFRFTKAKAGFFVYLFKDEVTSIEHDMTEVILYKFTGRKTGKGKEIYRKYG